MTFRGHNNQAMKYQATRNFINGQFTASTTTRKLDVISPVDGTLLSTVPMSSSKELDQAVKAAKAAFPGWSKTPIKERVQVFFKYKTLLEKNLKEFTQFINKRIIYGYSRISRIRDLH